MMTKRLNFNIIFTVQLVLQSLGQKFHPKILSVNENCGPELPFQLLSNLYQSDPIM